MKNSRQEAILDLISSRDIETQEELVQALRAKGYRVTQATISRDIKDLNLVKSTRGSGVRGYQCAQPVNQEAGVNDRLIRILRDSLLSVTQAQNLIVVKTLSGSANVAAEALDTLNWPEILGTIAGDNTVFIAVRADDDGAEVTERIRNLSRDEEKNGEGYPG